MLDMLDDTCNPTHELRQVLTLRRQEYGGSDGCGGGLMQHNSKSSFPESHEIALTQYEFTLFRDSPPAPELHEDVLTRTS